MDHSSSSFTESKALDQGSTSFISAKPYPSEPYSSDTGIRSSGRRIDDVVAACGRKLSLERGLNSELIGINYSSLQGTGVQLPTPAVFPDMS